MILTTFKHTHGSNVRPLGRPPLSACGPILAGEKVSVIRIKVGSKYVQFVTPEKLILTDDEEDAGVFSWEGSLRAEQLIAFHMKNAKDNPN
jgi:hypothetical protein